MRNQPLPKDQKWNNYLKKNFMQIRAESIEKERKNEEKNTVKTSRT